MADDPYATLGVGEERLGRGHPPRLPQARQGAASRHRQRHRGALQEGLLGLRDPRRSRKAARLRPRRDRRPRRSAPSRLPPVRTRGARRRGRRRGGGFDEFGFGDIFSDIFGAAGQRAGARPNFVSKGHDVRYTLEVDFLEAVSGATKRVTLPDGGTLDLNVPAGVTDAQVLRLKGTRAARRRRSRAGRCAGRNPRAPAPRSSSATTTTSCWRFRSPSTRRCSAPRSRCRPFQAACS